MNVGDDGNISAVSLRSDLLLLCSESNYSINRYYEFVGRERLTE